MSDCTFCGFLCCIFVGCWEGWMRDPILCVCVCVGKGGLSSCLRSLALKKPLFDKVRDWEKVANAFREKNCRKIKIMDAFFYLYHILFLYIIYLFFTASHTSPHFTIGQKNQKQTNKQSTCAPRKWRKSLCQAHRFFICECHLAGKGLMWPGRLPSVMICRAHREEKEWPSLRAHGEAEATEVTTFWRRQKKERKEGGNDRKKGHWGI